MPNSGGDIAGVGFITRNFNSAGLFRIDDLLAANEANGHAPSR